MNNYLRAGVIYEELKILIPPASLFQINGLVWSYFLPRNGVSDRVHKSSATQKLACFGHFYFALFRVRRMAVVGWVNSSHSRI